MQRQIKINFLRLVVLATLFGVASPVVAEEEGQPQVSIKSEPTAPARSPKFKATFDSFHYEFKGVKAATQNINGVSNYSFERVTYGSTHYGLGYDIDPTLNLTVSTRFDEIYAETRFFGVLYRDETSGLSDSSVRLTKTFLRMSGIYVGQLGVSLPTGSVTEKNPNAPGNVNYPYNMQLGSGTTDLLASGTYMRMLGKHQLGTFGMATVRTGLNSQGYRKGDEFMTKAWYRYQVTPLFGAGLSANYLNVQGVVGEDRTLTAADELLRFYYNPRYFWDVTPDVGFSLTDGSLTVKASVGAPLLQHGQNEDDIQLYTQWFLQTGVQGTF